MADSSGIGKGLAGCSCLGILLTLLVSVFFTVALQQPAVYEVVPPALLGISAPISWAANGCCCLSGLGMIVGIILIATGGKSDDDY